MTKLAEFLPPRNRHYPMDIAYCEAGPTMTKAEDGMLGYMWKAFCRNNEICVKREDLDEIHVITTKENITHLDITFDQTMRPFLCYVRDGLPYYYHFNKDDSSYSEVALDPTVTFPRCALDMPYDIPNSDIYIGYNRNGNLCYRIQRERFTKEYILATITHKSMVWRIGRTEDGRFGYQWR
mgnify:FL=1